MSGKVDKCGMRKKGEVERDRKIELIRDMLQTDFIDSR